MQIAVTLLGLEVVSWLPGRRPAKFALGPKRVPGAAAPVSEEEEAKALSPFRPYPGTHVLVFLLPWALSYQPLLCALYRWMHLERRRVHVLVPTCPARS